MKKNKPALGPIVAVIGDGDCTPEVYKLAEETGYLLAKKGASVLCGGYGGVMEAAARGAKRGGGLTIGILSGKDVTGANAWIDLPIVTGMRDARNTIIARTAHGVIAVSGGYGTLSELSFSLLYKKPVVGIRSWKLEHHNPSKKNLAFPNVPTPQKAVDLLYKSL